MDLVFIIAMEKEAEHAIKDNNYKLINDFPFKVYQNKNSLIIISGIGIGRASRCVGWVYEKYKPSKIINIGLAGSWNKEHKLLEELFVRRAFYSTVDITCASNYAYGQIPGGQKYYSPSLENILKIKESNIATSDIFVNSKDTLEQYIKKIDDDNVYLFDMECTSIMHSCHELNIKCCAIKIVSDILGSSISNGDQFEQSLAKGSIKISTIIKELVKGMRG